MVVESVDWEANAVFVPKLVHAGSGQGSGLSLK
jgi:hypothetical protein